MVQIMESKTNGTMWKSIKTVSETGVKSDPAFCLGPTIKKTNSEVALPTPRNGITQLRNWIEKQENCQISLRLLLFTENVRERISLNAT